MAAAEVCWCEREASQGGGGGLRRLGEAGTCPPVPWWGHQGSEGEREATGGASLSAHSGAVVNGRRGSTASDLGDLD